MPLKDDILCNKILSGEIWISIKFGGSLLVVRLSLRCDFPQAFGIACVLPSYSFALILSDPARAALGR